MKNNKGITLIALVITIIVLLILAGVSIAMLTGENGILTQATNARNETTRAEAVEKINMALNGAKAEVYKQQVDDSSWSPAVIPEGQTGVTNANDVQSAIKTLMAGDLGDEYQTTASATAVEGKYTYNVAGGKLSISYINSERGITTAVTGFMDLSAPYTLDKAE